MARLIGYARVSTEDQDTIGQRQALKAAGCTLIYEDIGSGASRTRPQLKKCLEILREGDMLVVTRLDRLARSVEHLYSVMADLRRGGVAFRSLRETFDTTTPSGKLMLGLLTMIAEFERELINERVRSGIAAAKARGVPFGNPAFKQRDLAAIAVMKATQADTYTERARAASRPWRQIVEEKRPHEAWSVVLDRINTGHYKGARPLSHETMMRHVRRLVAAGDLPASVLERTGRVKDVSPEAVVREILRDTPGASLREIGRQLLVRGVRPPRATKWTPQTVSRLLGETRQSGAEAGATAFG